MNNDQIDDILNEPLVQGGLASTLKLLKSQGALEKLSAEQKQDEKNELLRKQVLQKAKFEAPALYTNGKGSEKRVAMEKLRQINDKFSQYKPKISLSYRDEFGREMTPKEAFKQQCYGFHGQKPGKKKQEKRLRKIEEEFKRNNASTTDTASSVASAFHRHMEASGSSHIVLSVGKKVATDISIAPAILENNSKPTESSSFKAAETVGTQGNETKQAQARTKITFSLKNSASSKRKSDQLTNNEPPTKKIFKENT